MPCHGVVVALVDRRQDVAFGRGVVVDLANVGGLEVGEPKLFTLRQRKSPSAFHRGKFNPYLLEFSGFVDFLHSVHGLLDTGLFIGTMQKVGLNLHARVSATVAAFASPSSSPTLNVHFRSSTLRSSPRQP